MEVHTKNILKVKLRTTFHYASVLSHSNNKRISIFATLHPNPRYAQNFTYPQYVIPTIN